MRFCSSSSDLSVYRHGFDTAGIQSDARSVEAVGQVIGSAAHSLEAKNLQGFIESLNQDINLFFGSVDIEARACRCGQAIAFHDGLYAVMTGAHSNTCLLIENRSQIMRVDVLQGKGDNAPTLLDGAGSVDCQPFNAAQLL